MTDSIRSDEPPVVAATTYWPNPQVCVVRLAGEIDASTAPYLAGCLREYTRTRPAHLVVDLADVQFMASAGVGLILSAQHNADGIHGRLHLLGVTHPVARVLELCGVLPRLDIHDSLDDVLAHTDAD